MSYEYAVIGGGIVGSCIAYGLTKYSRQVAVLDEGDIAFRASRGNFGLVWVQGKGWDYPAYADWTWQAAAAWPDLAAELLETSGIDVGLSQPGGIEMCLEDEELSSLEDKMRRISEHTDGGFHYEMLDHSSVLQRVPEISKEVAGACFCPHDGHVNPLLLFRALHQGMKQSGAEYLPNRKIEKIEFSGEEFRISGDFKDIHAARIILCAGLQNQVLGEMVGIRIPVIANRGQLLITEKVRPFLKYPTLHVRQTSEGGLQIGDSSEEVGLNDSTSNSVLSMLASRATRIFPMLENVQVVRAWAALRIMTPDGKPVYQESESCPGAFAIACHSGITLAAAHVGPVCQWIAKSKLNPLISQFSSDRFHV
ncbi:MAG: FAD-binding oxidoreductase [Acidiferrobacterales bacterium]|nr:FAD-binding oxidoreductase [Acidiferrobacterales bacterium]